MLGLDLSGQPSGETVRSDVPTGWYARIIKRLGIGQPDFCPALMLAQVLQGSCRNEFGAKPGQHPPVLPHCQDGHVMRRQFVELPALLCLSHRIGKRTPAGHDDGIGLAYLFQPVRQMGGIRQTAAELGHPPSYCNHIARFQIGW